MKVLVCGGRDFEDAKALNRALDDLHAKTPITLLIHGNARGADLLADEWAFERGVKVKRFPADWVRHRNSAGPIRNKQMLVEGKPELVIAFRGGAGTSDMMAQARRAGVEVREIR